MNAFTNIPQLPDPENKPAIEWQQPIIHSVPGALDDTGCKIDRLLVLLDSTVDEIGELGGLGRPITGQQITPIYMMTQLVREGLAQISGTVAAILYASECADHRPTGRTGGDRRKWVNALSRYNAAEARGTDGMTDDELEADGEATSEALARLLEMRCPDLRALAEKLNVIERTDATMMVGTMEHVRRDVAQLAGMAEPASSTPKLVEV